MSSESRPSETSIQRALRGVLPVFQTPYHDDESIDCATLKEEIDWLYDRGADGIVMAMVSEVLRLSSEEREELAARACEFGRDRGVVVISVGAESTHTAVRYARHAESAGADAVMAIPPVSIATLESETLRYYERIITAIEIPVIIQDASGYVGRPMPVALLANMLDEFGDRVLFKPEAEPIVPRLTELRDATNGRARVFEGSGGIALKDSYRCGIIGTMPGADLIDGIVALWRALEAGNEKRAAELSETISAIIALQSGLDGFLAVEKRLLVHQGVFKNTIVRGPVGFELDENTWREVLRLYDALQEALQQEA
jgi:4-hydroxy-tetrahydrodipicolinate synthase